MALKPYLYHPTYFQNYTFIRMKFKNKEKEMSLENTFVSQVIDNEAAVIVPFARVDTVTTGGKVADEGQ